MNLAKCEFATVTFFDKVVGHGVVRPVNAEIEAIEKYPPPFTKRELMCFLGLVGYYWTFCRSPLTDLLKVLRTFIWNLTCQDAFGLFKALLTSAPVLAAFRWDRPFKMNVHASEIGAGAVLLQDDEEGIERPVCFFSRKFLSYQSNYLVIEKEGLVLVWAFQHYYVYEGGGGGWIARCDLLWS